jgi:FtsH-binding integral membrane protein
MTQSYDTDQAFPSFGARTDTRTLFGQTMGLVAVTTGLFALGAYLARNLPGGWGVIFWLASLGGLLAMNVSVRQSEQLTLGLLFGFGLLVGLATAPTIAYYANAAPRRSGRPAGRRRCLWPASAPPATPPDETSPPSPACSGGR